MSGVPLPSGLKIPRVETLVAALCLAASLIGAGFVFIGGFRSLKGICQVTLEAAEIGDSYFTDADTVGEFLTELGIEYSEYDRIEPLPDAPIRPGLVISYCKARRISIADAGEPEREIMCPAETVCDLLYELGLDISPTDRVEPDPATELEDGMRVVVTRVDVIDVTAEREIEPPLVIEADPELPRGRMVEVSPGEPGVAEDVVRYYYRNGEQTARVEIGSRVVREPEQRVARVGVRSVPPLASRGGAHRDVLTMDATAYDPSPSSCWPYADGRTATGHIAGRGVCAVDPGVIPLGTELWVEGYGYALACDTGGAIRGNRIDLCFNTRAEAMRWGRRTVLVYILD